MVLTSQLFRFLVGEISLAGALGANRAFPRRMRVAIAGRRKRKVLLRRCEQRTFGRKAEVLACCVEMIDEFLQFFVVAASQPCQLQNVHGFEIARFALQHMLEFFGGLLRTTRIHRVNRVAEQGPSRFARHRHVTRMRQRFIFDQRLFEEPILFPQVSRVQPRVR